MWKSQLILFINEFTASIMGWAIISMPAHPP